jgi:hypothetical protein
MKEKITVIIILTSIVALLFHHQSQDNNTQLTSLEDNISTQPEVALNSVYSTEDELMQLSVEQSLSINECITDPMTTDSLTFKDVFSHFRKCLGPNQEFSWKGQSYLTLLAEEVEGKVIQVADSTIVEKNNVSDLEIVTH